MSNRITQLFEMYDKSTLLIIFNKNMKESQKGDT